MRNRCIPRISPPLRFVLRLRLQKGGEGGGGGGGGVFAGHYGMWFTLSPTVFYPSDCGCESH